MKGVVHYLVRDPSESNALIYPARLPESYAAYGGFYLLCDTDGKTSESYDFLAVQGEEIITTRLDLRLGTNTIFQVDLLEVGNFEFKANLLKPMSLQDNSRFTKVNGESFIVRQLKPKDPQILNSAVRQHDFYFVGFTENLEDQLHQ